MFYMCDGLYFFLKLAHMLDDDGEAGAVKTICDS